MSTPTTSTTSACPYCALPHPAQAETGVLADLHAEVARIRELAERPTIAQYERRIAELSEEVTQLRATVARLRAVR